jgi:trk system potassium uptake protein TrkH
VIITISLLIICGGLGFPVILDLIKKKKFKRLGVHSKVVLTTTAALIVIGTVYIFLAEYNNYETLGNLSLGAKFLAALFQSVTARTAGFNSIELSLMSQAAIFIMIILMFIGASPASTGGGIKTTTLATIIITVKSFLSGKADIEIYERRIGDITLKKSIGIFVIAIGLIIFGTLTISLLEPNYTLLECAFEVVSALTTAGLSIIGSLNLSLPSKLIIMSYMFVGRVGSLTIFMAIIYRGNKKRQLIKYPEGKIIVG